MKKNVRIPGSGSLWTDTPDYYGSVSRLLHWGMAYLMLWQFTMVLGWRAFGPSENIILVSQFGPDHGTVGLLTFVLIVLRAAWAFANRQSPTPASAFPRMGRANQLCSTCDNLSPHVRDSCFRSVTCVWKW